jgi:hypothetical protein
LRASKPEKCPSGVNGIEPSSLDSTDDCDDDDETELLRDCAGDDITDSLSDMVIQLAGHPIGKEGCRVVSLEVSLKSGHVAYNL